MSEAAKGVGSSHTQEALKIGQPWGVQGERRQLSEAKRPSQVRTTAGATENSDNLVPGKPAPATPTASHCRGLACRLFIRGWQMAQRTMTVMETQILDVDADADDGDTDIDRCR